MSEGASIEQLSQVPVRHVLGVPVHAVRAEEAVRLCRNAAEQGSRLMVGVVNAAKIVKMQDDPLLSESVLGSDLIIADGMAVVWASRLLGNPLPERVTGIDLFEGLLAAAEQAGLSVYFLGARQDCLDEVLVRARQRHPALKIAGSHDGYFGDEDEPAIADEIKRLAPDFLFVGITTPKKEIFMDRWGQHMGVPVCHGVGGSFDVYAGKTRRAPEAWQRLGIEWLYRVLQEPRRMWRRYLVTNTAFICMVVAEWLRGHFRRSSDAASRGTPGEPR